MTERDDYKIGCSRWDFESTLRLKTEDPVAWPPTTSLHLRHPLASKPLPSLRGQIRSSSSTTRCMVITGSLLRPICRHCRILSINSRFHAPSRSETFHPIHSTIILTQGKATFTCGERCLIYWNSRCSPRNPKTIRAYVASCSAQCSSCNADRVVAFGRQSGWVQETWRIRTIVKVEPSTTLHHDQVLSKLEHNR